MKSKLKKLVIIEKVNTWDWEGVVFLWVLFVGFWTLQFVSLWIKDANIFAFTLLNFVFNSIMFLCIIFAYQNQTSKEEDIEKIVYVKGDNKK